jgi:uncharacterized protein (DUF58 family)
LIIWGLLLAALLSRNSDLAWLALPFFIYLGTGLLQAPTPNLVHLQAVRTVKRTAPPQGDRRIDVQVTVSNQGASISNLYLTDDPPGEAKNIAGKASQRAALPGGAQAVLSYSIPDKRGSYRWETTRAVISDPLDLFALEVALPACAGVQVQPEYGQYRRLPLRPGGTLHSPGSIPARLGGNGVDFWGVREYQPGDSLRWLDWRLTARHPQRLFTKEFEQEEIADIGLILDARQKTDVQRLAGGDSLFEHAVSAAASIAEAFLHEGHRMSLLAVNGSTKVVFPGYGKVQLNRMSRLALRASGLERQLLLRDIAALQIPVIDWHVSQPLYPLLRHALNTTLVRT